MAQFSPDIILRHLKNGNDTGHVRVLNCFLSVARDSHHYHHLTNHLRPTNSGPLVKKAVK